MIPSDYPVVYGKLVDRMWQGWCCFCGKTHRHAPNPGLRISHCNSDWKIRHRSMGGPTAFVYRIEFGDEPS